MRVRERRYGSLILSIFFVAATFLSGCVNHLEKGWEHFGKGEYQTARGEWVQNEKPKLPDQIGKADAALSLVDLAEKITSAKAEKDYPAVIRYSKESLLLDQWEVKDWLQKSPILQTYLDSAHPSIEDGYFQIFEGYKELKLWEKIKTEYPDYQKYCVDFSKAVSVKITGQYENALSELKKIADEQERLVRERERQAREKARQDKLRAAVDQKVDIGKKSFLEEDYESSMTAVNSAYAIVEENPIVKFDTDDLEYLKLSTLQAIKIQKAMEEERKRVAQQIAEKERKRIEEENRKAAEAARLKELERQRIEVEKIRLAATAEKKRLRIEEEKRKKEAERKRKVEERNRRWRAFLKKGSPLKPLVTTVYRPSSGIGKLKIKKKQKWQGGSQLPKPKDKSISAEDVYALEVEVPKTHKLIYLRNYHRKKAKSLLSPPVTQGKKRSYYTENFKGGRYYMEVRNQKGKQQKYEVKTRIYKIPVTH